MYMYGIPVGEEQRLRCFYSALFNIQKYKKYKEDYMNAAIIVCSTLTNHVKAAQKKMNTNYPIIELDKS